MALRLPKSVWRERCAKRWESRNQSAFPWSPKRSARRWRTNPMSARSSLNLASAKELRAAFAEIEKIAKRARIALDGVLIAEQISDGLELVLGVHRDPEMGPVILFGAGGVELELHPDVALGALPLDEPAALALIARTRVAKLDRRLSRQTTARPQGAGQSAARTVATGDGCGRAAGIHRRQSLPAQTPRRPRPRRPGGAG